MDNADIRPSAPGAFFFYQNVMSSLLESSPQHHTIIYGGRGLGKSSFLAELKTRLQDQANVGLFSVSDEGLNWDHSIATMRTLTGGYLLVDDFDRLILHAGSQDPSRSPLEQLSALLSATRDSGHAVIATSSVTPEVLGRSVDGHSSFSDEIQRRFRQYILNPWAPGWELRLRALFTNSIGALPSEEVSIWLDALLRVTGGHPSLVGAALTVLGQLAETDALTLEAFLPPTGSSDTDLPGRNVLAYLGTALRPGLTRIRTAIETLARSNPTAFKILRAHAEGEDGAMLLHGNAREASHFELRFAGLLYLDVKTSEHRVPGDLVRELILQTEFDDEAARYTLVDGEISSRGSIVRLGEPEAKLDLSGKLWLILKYLYSRRGEPAPIEDIRRELGFNTPRAFRSAYQRLESELRAKGFDATENVRGRGYRFKYIE